MKARRSLRGFAVLATVALLVGLLGAGGAAASPPSGSGGERVAVIGVFHDSVGNPRAAAQDLERRYNGKLEFVYEHAIRGFAGEFPRGSLTGLERDGRVDYIELDQVVTIAEHTTPTGIQRIFAPGNSEIDIDATDDFRVDVDVAVIDTGIDLDHPDLNVFASTNCFYSNSGGPPWGRNYYCDAGGDDDNGHGTHVAGTIGAMDNGVGVVGVAPGARVWAVKVLDRSGSGYMSNIVAGVDYVTANAASIEVANMSLGCECSSSALNEAIAASVDAGVVYAVAAGNSDKNVTTFSPANHPDVIAVSALADFDGVPGGLGAPTCRSDEDDTLANFSNWGSSIDIAAPGVCILSTSPGGGLATYSGTSMASPHVAGAAALLASTSNPSNQADVENVETKLENNGNFNWVDGSGDGTKEPLLDVSNSTVFNPALVPGSSDGGGGSPADNPPSAAIASPANGATVGGTVLLQVSAADSEDATGTLDVEIRIDGGTWAATSYNSGSGRYEYSWNSTGVADGAHTIDARATDSKPQTTNAAQVGVTVSNSSSPATANDTITKTQFGGKTSDHHVDVTVTISAGSTLIAGASVTVQITLNGSPWQSPSGTTNSTGQVVFGYRGIPSGTYVATVTGVMPPSPFVWDGSGTSVSWSKT